MDWKAEVEFLRFARELNAQNVNKDFLAEAVAAAEDDAWAAAWLDELFSHTEKEYETN